MDLLLCIALFHLIIIIFTKQRELSTIYRCKSRRLVLFQRQENNYIIPHSCEQFNLSGGPSQDE